MVAPLLLGEPFMHSTNYLVIGLGEILWDLFPDGKKLGGAPTNFAYISTLLGNEGVVASRLGNDAFGTEIQTLLQSLRLEARYLQTDFTHPTGTVKVQLDPQGHATFEFSSSVAWDFLDWTSQWQSLSRRADAICFGSLAQRSLRSRETIRKFLASVPPQTLRIFDVNLRQSYFSNEIIEDSAKLAHIMKLNSEELPVIAKMFGIQHTDELSTAQHIRQRFNLKLICVTRGPEGSLLVDENSHHEHPSFPATVVDTVGAGDAFTAALVYHFLRNASLETMNIAANYMGAWVASQPGATPPADERHLRLVRNPALIQRNAQASPIV